MSNPSTSFDHDEALTLADLAILERVFTAQCALRGFDVTSESAEELTNWLIALFQRGIRTEAQLMATMSRSRNQSK